MKFDEWGTHLYCLFGCSPEKIALVGAFELNSIFSVAKTNQKTAERARLHLRTLFLCLEQGRTCMFSVGMDKRVTKPN
jgi:hypothetical protein